MNTRMLIENVDFSGRSAYDLEKEGVDPYVPGWAEIAMVGTLTFADDSKCDVIILRHGKSGCIENYYCVKDRSAYRHRLGYMVAFDAREWAPFKIDVNAATAPTNGK